MLEVPEPGWTGAVGFITRDVLEDALPADRAGVQCYVCGPPAMMAAMERTLIDAGVPPRQVHAELFTFA